MGPVHGAVESVSSAWGWMRVASGQYASVGCGCTGDGWDLASWLRGKEKGASKWGGL